MNKKLTTREEEIRGNWKCRRERKREGQNLRSNKRNKGARYITGTQSQKQC